MAISQRGCRTCHSISDQMKCPKCGSETSKEWQGYLIVVDPERSEIARKMGIKSGGRYALRVK